MVSLPLWSLFNNPKNRRGFGGQEKRPGFGETPDHQADRDVVNILVNSLQGAACPSASCVALNSGGPSFWNQPTIDSSTAQAIASLPGPPGKGLTEQGQGKHQLSVLSQLSQFGTILSFSGDAPLRPMIAGDECVPT